MKYLLTGLGKGTYNSGNPIAAENIWKTFKENSEASGSLWTEDASGIFRTSQVTIGQGSIINAQFGIKQNNLAAGLRIDGYEKSNRRTIIHAWEGATERYRLDNWGIAQWYLTDGTSDIGALAYTTQFGGFIGLMSASNFSYLSNTRGYILWAPLNTNGAADSCRLATNNSIRIGISYTGRMRFNRAYLSGTSYSFGGISGDSIIADFRDFANEVGLQISSTGILTNNLTSSTARLWKLGERLAGTVSLDTTQYITVEVNGVEYKLAIVV